jgi:hypothetical protein
MSLYTCTKCGSELPNEEAICSVCEEELKNEFIPGKYICPSCFERFDTVKQRAWPPGVPWYHPQDLKAICPHCEIFLKDKTQVQQTPIDKLFFYAVIIFIIFTLFNKVEKYVLYVFVACYLTSTLHSYWRFRKVKKFRHEEARYEVQK